MIPAHRNGLLPAGIYEATWAEVVTRFGTNPRRVRLLRGLRTALVHLAGAGCERAYLAGSFVTTKAQPGDVDVAWSAEGVEVDLVHPMFLDPWIGRDYTKAMFGAEFFPADAIEGDSGVTFVEFFQSTKDGEPVGIVALDLSTLEADDDS